MRVIDELVAESFTSRQQERLTRICDRPGFLHVSAALVADARERAKPKPMQDIRRELQHLEVALRKLSPEARIGLNAGYKMQTQEGGFVFPDYALVENLLAGIERVKGGMRKQSTLRQWIGQEALRIFAFYKMKATTYEKGAFVSYFALLAEVLPQGFDAAKLASELLTRKDTVFFFDC